MLIPPEVQRRFVNTSTDPLEMVMVEWPANAIARKDILVRDVALLPFCEENAHWNNMSKCVFTQADGMTGRVLLVMLMPMTMAAPHPHVFGTEEIWTKITPGNSLTLLGSELMWEIGAGSTDVAELARMAARLGEEIPHRLRPPYPVTLAEAVERWR